MLLTNPCTASHRTGVFYSLKEFTLNQLITSNQSLTMSSREIAELTGKRHDNVKTDIEKMLIELKLNVPEFTGTYTATNGNSSLEFNLPKRECLILVSGYSIQLRSKIIDRWQELEAKNNKPLTRKEMALMVIAQEEEIERLQIELDQSKQWLTIKKVAAHNNVNWKSLEWRKLKEISIVIGLLPRKIFDSNFYDGVNVYHKDAWKIVYPTLDLPNGEC